MAMADPHRERSAAIYVDGFGGFETLIDTGA